jgi:diketogulonate reductase-like aldo/keto reductase
MQLNLSTTITLNNGVRIPTLGLGTWQTRGKIAEEVIRWALTAGYRHIDTARAYVNEQKIGNVIREIDIDRDDIFITTKLWITHHGYERTLKAIDLSLKSLGLDYVDLYLIHWPVMGFTETWKAMEMILAIEKARAIGVSNFMIHHLEELLATTNTVPAVNQVEFTPYLYDEDLLNYCEKHSIKIAAYSPLTRGIKLDDPRLIQLANTYTKTPAQILIRWGLQHGLIELPKSKRKSKIIENSHVFDFSLSEEDMKLLDSFNENLRVPGNPTHRKLSEQYLE